MSFGVEHNKKMRDCSFSELTSARLRLRRLQTSDAQALCAYRSLPEVARFQSWDTFGSEDAARLISEQASLRAGTPGTWFQLALVNSASDSLIGDCGLHFLANDTHQVEVGITLAPAHQSRGFATEALRCVLDYFLSVAGSHRVFAITDVENQAAASLFRRLGFREEGRFVENVWFKGKYGSEFLFALLAREWTNARHCPAPARP